MSFCTLGFKLTYGKHSGYTHMLKQSVFKHGVPLVFTLMLSLFSSSVWAAGENMSRIDQAQATQQRLFGNTVVTATAQAPVDKQSSNLSVTDPELTQIEERLVFGELFYEGSLSDKQRILVLIASLLTTSSLDELGQYVQAGLNLKLSPVEIREAIYQCAPYVGLGKVKAALKEANAVFIRNQIELPLENQAQVTEQDRFEKGKAAQIASFGDGINQMHASAAPEQRYLIVNHLSAYCFGDIFTRSGLLPQERELVIFAAIMSLGGAESQLKSHAQANMALGNTKQNLFDTAALLVPYIGFPRTLNAVGVIHQL